MKKWGAFLLLLSCAGMAYGQPLPPPNPVPIDGGLSLLIAAGGGLGYRYYKKQRSVKQKNINL